MNMNTPKKTAEDLPETSVSPVSSHNSNEIAMQGNLAFEQDISSTVSSDEKKDGTTLLETIKSPGKKPEDMLADKSETSVSPRSSRDSKEISMEENLEFPQAVTSSERKDGISSPEVRKSPGKKPEKMSADQSVTFVSPGSSSSSKKISKQSNFSSPLPSTSGPSNKRKNGVPLSQAIQPRGGKPVTMEAFTDYMKKRFGISSIENLTSLKSVTRSGKEYGSKPDKELAKKKRGTSASTDTPAPKRVPVKKNPAAMTLAKALKNTKPKKKPVLRVPTRT